MLIRQLGDRLWMNPHRQRFPAEESRQAADILGEGSAKMEDAFWNQDRPRCGVQLNRGQEFYNDDGCLLYNCLAGVYEVGGVRA